MLVRKYQLNEAGAITVTNVNHQGISVTALVQGYDEVPLQIRAALVSALNESYRVGVIHTYNKLQVWADDQIKTHRH